MELAPTSRIRRSPFFEATRRYGVTAFSVYNRMYLPMRYSDPETEFWNLVDDVTLWDVATCPVAPHKALRCKTKALISLHF